MPEQRPSEDESTLPRSGGEMISRCGNETSAPVVLALRRTHPGRRLGQLGRDRRRSAGTRERRGFLHQDRRRGVRLFQRCREMASTGDRLVDRGRREPVRAAPFGVGGPRDHSGCEKRVDESRLAAG